jgi:hypothetical protein
MVKVFRFAAMAIAMAAISGGAAQAVQLWYDGFEIDDANPGSATTYVTGELNGQDGGTGSYFTGTWLSGNDPDGVSNYIEAGSLSANGQNPPSTGDKVGDGPEVFGGCCRMARSSRLYSSSTLGYDGTVWMSFLANFGTGNVHDPHFRMVEWWNGLMDDTALSMQLGVQGFGNYDHDNDPNTPNVTDDRYILKVTGVDSLFGSAVTRTLPVGERFYESHGKTQAVVIRFDFSTNDVELGLGAGDAVSLWWNPSPADLLGAPDVYTDNIDIHIDRMSAMSLFHFTGGPTLGGAFDELRVGTTLADVMLTVPEPASLALVGLGLVAFAVRRGQRA